MPTINAIMENNKPPGADHFPPTLTGRGALEASSPHFNNETNSASWWQIKNVNQSY